MNQANYYYCTALGFNTVADSGEAAFASGYMSQALNNGAVALGWQTTAHGPYSFSGGDYTKATAMSSFAFGLSSISNGVAATAFGFNTIAGSDYSLCLGYMSKTRGTAATAIGSYALASGNNSLAVGYQVNSHAYASLALGMFNDTITGSSSTNWVSTDPVLTIGNGAYNALHNAFTVLKNGYTAIGHSAPAEMLDVNGNARFRSVPTGTGTALYIDVNGSLVKSASDESLKHNIIHITGALDKVMQMNGMYYYFKSDPENKRKLGFIAQDMEKILPEAVYTNSVDGLKGINYAELTAVLAEAIKEQQSIIESQQKEIDRLKGLESRISQLEEILNAKK
jgi:hypothetical protein